jgi:hypothetical protein
MPESDRPNVVGHGADPPGRWEAICIAAALPIVLNLISMLGCAYTVFAAIQSVRWHGGKNFANLALLVVGVPTLFVQVVVVLPLTLFCARTLRSGAPGVRIRWLRYLAVLLPVVTLTAIVMGMVMTEMNQAKGP